MTPTTCPKCGAEEGNVHIIAGGFASRWTCGSGEDFQSYKCRIRQLEAENALLRALNEQLANRVHAQSELLSKRAEKGVS